MIELLAPGGRQRRRPTPVVADEHIDDAGATEAANNGAIEGKPPPSELALAVARPAATVVVKREITGDESSQAKRDRQASLVAGLLMSSASGTGGKKTAADAAKAEAELASARAAASAATTDDSHAAHESAECDAEVTDTEADAKKRPAAKAAVVCKRLYGKTSPTADADVMKRPSAKAAPAVPHKPPKASLKQKKTSPKAARPSSTFPKVPAKLAATFPKMLSDKPITFAGGKIYKSLKKRCFRVYLRARDRVESSINFGADPSESHLQAAFNYGCQLIVQDPRPVHES